VTGRTTHRLDGLEPDNLLAFMALLGLLRVLEETRPDWRPRVFWTFDEPPLRPTLRVQETADETAIVEAASEGLRSLSACHDFDVLRDLTLLPKETARRLGQAAAEANEAPYTADLVGSRQRCGDVPRPQEGRADAALPHVRSGTSALPGASRFGSPGIDPTGSRRRS